MNISFDRSKSGHSDYVRSLSLLDNNLLVSGSRDGMIKIWDLNIRKIKFTFNSTNLGHTNWVSSLAKYASVSFASGSHDSNIKLWSF